MKKPDNIVFNYESNKYDAFKKSYPTSFSAKSFNLEKIKNLKLEAQPYFKGRFNELKEQYEKLLIELKWNEEIFNSKINFNPIIGQKYYLYKKKNYKFLSIIKPSEWDMEFIGTFILNSNQSWKKIK
tara:strand:+ start:85 stop:465 length:381 start_codon:yes stop_codon:yes gene_type:complete